MNDKRDTQRQNVIKAGTISFDGTGIDCLVRNMSVGGANLVVDLRFPRKKGVRSLGTV